MKLAIAIFVLFAATFPPDSAFSQEPTVEDLIAQLRDEDPQSRTKAALALALRGVESKAAIPDLVRASADEDALVRETATTALNNIRFALLESDIEDVDGRAEDLEKSQDRLQQAVSELKGAVDASSSSGDSSNSVSGFEILKWVGGLPTAIAIFLLTYHQIRKTRLESRELAKKEENRAAAATDISVATTIAAEDAKAPPIGNLMMAVIIRFIALELGLRGYSVVRNVLGGYFGIGGIIFSFVYDVIYWGILLSFAWPLFWDAVSLAKAMRVTQQPVSEETS